MVVLFFVYIDKIADHVRINVCKGQHQNISTLESSASSRSSKGRNNITLSDSGIYIYKCMYEENHLYTLSLVF